ncbi:MAG: hypothetical protein H7Y86_20410 [Rhizobacter sp.]|nr:hypothetical protein [Ferruginibacter sp.]
MKKLGTLLLAVFITQLMSAQNVGIGTSTPLEKVDVDGSLRLTGNSRLIKFETGTANLGTTRYIPGIGFIRADGTQLGKIEYVDTLSFASFMRMRMGNDFSNGITLNTSNNAGIGTAEPLARLHVRGTTGIDELAISSGNLDEESTIQFYSGGIGAVAAVKKIFIQLNENDLRLGTNSNNDNGKFIIRNNGNDRMFVDSAGNVTIGTTYKVASGYKLSVNGKIMSEEVRVQMDADWPDYVFEKDYKLMPMDELENYISTNKHLPGIAPAAEVKANGIDLGNTNKQLLEKIEELTLYMLALKKEIDQLKTTINLINTKSH